jgi:hypothetical protein
MRSKFFRYAVLFLWVGSSPAWAVGTWISTKCQQGDEQCIRYVPACMECERFLCEQVSNGETGYDNCQTVFYGATPTSCTAWGSFCSQITVTP